MSLFSFKLNKEFVAKYSSKKAPFGYTDAAGNSVGEITFIRTYSRKKECEHVLAAYRDYCDDKYGCTHVRAAWRDECTKQKETWVEVCQRVINGMYSLQKDYCKTNRLPWNDVKAQASAQEAFDRLFNLQWTPPGRGLWVMGTPLVNYYRNSAALQNCAFVSTRDMLKNDPAKPFVFLMEASMLGVGVGFDDKGADKDFVIHKPVTKAVTSVIPDSREGWVDSVATLINAYLRQGSAIPDFDYSLIRPAGEPISTFGGTAAGPGPLKKLHAHIHKLFYDREGEKLTRTDIADLGNLIGVCVVSGNVRRSAELLIGRLDDTEFIDLKNHEVNPARNFYDPSGENSGWGWMSNNSVEANVGDDVSHIIDKIANNGEPGIIYMDLSRKYGRLADPENNKDWRITGYNPCVTGDTLVAVADGRNAVTIKQLFEENTPTPVYTSDSEKNVVIGMATKFMLTQKDADIYKVTLDDGSSVRATANHLFMLKDGTYTPVSELLPGQSLMPFNSYISNKAYRQIARNNRRDRRQYRMIADFHGLLENVDAKTTAVHHADFNSFNDRITNFRIMPHEDHKELHASRMRGDRNPMRRPEVAAKVSATMKINMLGAGNGMYGKTQSDSAKTLIGNKSKQNWENNKDSMSLSIKNAMNAPGVKERLSKEAKARRVDVICEKCERKARVYPSKIKNEKWYCSDCALALYNHKVVSVDYCGKEDVYDLTVPGTHNFGIITSVQDSRAIVSSGIFIHNCAEQSLESYECCTLVETYLGRHETLEDYKRTLKFAYLYAKTVTLLPTHWEETNAIMQRNRRIGTSMSGVANFTDRVGMPTLRKWMDEGYNTIKRYDNTYSEWLGIRESIKMTTVKPSGTVSILAGESPGVHWTPGGEYFMRAIRFSNEDPMLTLFTMANYRVEPASESPETTSVVFFPVKSNAVRSEKDVTIFEKAAIAATAQRYWSDNSVSVTVSFDAEKEAEHVATVLHMYDGQLKTVSFLPMGNKTYLQMPYTQIAKDEYEDYTMRLFPIDFSGIYAGLGIEAVGDAYCTTDACEVKLIVENLKDK